MTYPFLLMRLKPAPSLDTLQDVEISAAHERFKDLYTLTFLSRSWEKYSNFTACFLLYYSSAQSETIWKKQNKCKVSVLLYLHTVCWTVYTVNVFAPSISFLSFLSGFSLNLCWTVVTVYNLLSLLFYFEMSK